MKKIICCLFLINVAFINGQDVKNYKWEENPKYQTVKIENSNYPAVVLKLVKRLYFKNEFITNSDYSFELNHTQIAINKEKAIDDYNKVYIPVPTEKQVERLIARVIKPNGSVQNFQKSNIKLLKDTKYGNITVFALEGVEKGDIIEYLYVIKRYFNKTGIVTFQKDIPIEFAEFAIICSDKFDFEIKPINGFSEAKLSDEGNKKTLKAVKENIPALLNEPYSTYHANKMKIVYRMAKRRQMFIKSSDVNWNSISLNIRNYFNYSIPSKVNSTFKSLKINPSLADKEKVLLIENYVKNNYTKKNVASNPITIIKNKYGNEQSLSVLTYHLLKRAKVKQEIVLTSNRFNNKLDPSFPYYNILEDVLIYIPSLDKYLTPGRVDYRLGYPPFTAIGNYGLFIKKETHRLNKINSPSNKYTSKINDIKLNITDDLSDLTLDINQSISGYYTVYPRAAFAFGSEKDKTEIIESLKSGFEEADIVTSNYSNLEFEKIVENEPLKFTATINAPNLIENGGEFYLLKIGKVIGKQVEIVDEHERTNPIEIRYPKYYNHKISFQIPLGYKVENLEDGNMKAELNNSALFESVATLEDNIVTINIEEYYNYLTYGSGLYNEFKGVMNAAAKFNKLTFILTKE